MWQRPWRCRWRAITWWWICREVGASHSVIARSAPVRRSPPSGEGGCDEAIHSFFALSEWIASRSLSSGAHSRDPLARNDVDGLNRMLHNPPLNLPNRTRRRHGKIDAMDPQRKSARINTCTELCAEIRFYADRNGLSGSAHVGRLELVAIAGEHAHVTPRRNRTVVSC
jgi:hypothetical protein